MKLKEKVVLITDGLSAAGVAIAERFKAEGAILALNVYRSDNKGFDTPHPVNLAETKGEPDMLTFANPVSKKEVDDAVSSVLARYGRIDVVIHNNNEVVKANLEDCDDETYDRALDINAKSAFLFVKAAGAPMKQARKGSFVFISSIHDEKPNGAAFAYSIAKGAVKMLAKEMVLDLGPFNIRTNIVSMGPMEGSDKLFSSDLSPLYEHTKERIPNESCCTPEEAANAALFFAGDDCPSANGSELRLDGGFLLSYYTRANRSFSPQENFPDGAGKKRETETT